MDNVNTYKVNKEAVKKIAERVYDNGSTVINRNDLEEIFPELSESEDERIRKELLSFCQNRADNYPNDPKYANIGNWIAWLEKQGEQKSADEIKPKFKVGDLVKYTNHNKQPIYKVNYIDKECYICTSDDATLGDKAVMHFAFDNPYLRLVEQKFAAWSEEDESNLNGILNCYKSMDIKWRNWLKSLRHQPHWMPSNEQIKALKSACEEHWEPDGLDPLYTLYQDLKKLREE